jgi:tryptophan synthase alpha chain
MSRLANRLEALRERGEKALICYVVAGDPSLERTVDIVSALADAGVDAIELGVPFSDPLADGPSIQASSQRALEQGVTVAKVFETVHAIRARTDIPIVLMTYFNPTLRYGVDRFARDAAAAGVDGTIQTDLTPEEADDWLAASRANSLDTVFLLAPTSTNDRIDVVARLSSGFVYCVSRTGVTGARQDIPEELPSLIMRVKERTRTPVCVGFGISNPDHVRRIGALADGVVVGSALVDVIARNGDGPSLLTEVHAFTAGLKAATLANPS